MENKQNIFEEIKTRLNQKTSATITMETNLKDIGVDSLDLLDLVVEAEDHYGVQIPDGILSQLNTVEDVVEALHAQIIIKG